MDEQAFHRWAREKGTNHKLYRFVRAIIAPCIRLWFRPHVEGVKNIPLQGPVLICPNHKSFFDTFLIGVYCPREVRFMAKRELMRGPATWFFPRMGVFPVARGSSDSESMETARQLLKQGEVVVIFPEGTRIHNPRAIGSPHHGAARLALETNTPIIPCAIKGTHKLFLGPIAKPRHVQVAFAPPVKPDAGIRELMDEAVWPAVQEAYTRQLARPGLILSALALLGLGAGLRARRVRQAKTRVLGVVPPTKVRRQEQLRQLKRRLKMH